MGLIYDCIRALPSSRRIVNVEIIEYVLLAKNSPTKTLPRTRRRVSPTPNRVLFAVIYWSTQYERRLRVVVTVTVLIIWGIS